jgi:hypothetical protein
MDNPAMSWRSVAVVAVVAGTVATLVAIELVRPWAGAPIAFDTASSALHFDRIVNGQRLEAALSTTPKPWLTFIAGSLYALTGSWTAIALATIAAFAVAVALAAALAQRIDGLVAASFVAAALVSSVALLGDMAISLATAWALAGALAAALALAADRPRWALAGLALLIAGLARIEMLILPVATAAILGALTVRARRASSGPEGGPASGTAAGPPAAAWLLVVIPLLAVPVMFLHDWLLTGDPLYWAGVAARYSEQLGTAVPGPVDIARLLVGLVVGLGGLTALAALGLARLATGRAPWLAAGLLVVGFGVAVALLALAVRGVFVTGRYALPIELAIVVAAAFGLAAISVEVAGRIRALREPPAGAEGGPRTGADGRAVGQALSSGVAIAVGAGLAVLLSGGIGALDRELRVDVRERQQFSRNLEAAGPAMADALGAAAGDAATTGARLLVPVAGRTRLSLDLGLPLTEIGSTNPATLDPAAGVPAPGQLVFHDEHGDPDSEAYGPFETLVPLDVGAVTLVPVANDPEAGWWLVSVRESR